MLCQVKVQSFYCGNKRMKDKFSIFSDGLGKSDNLQTSINFKKSPNKFAIYEPNNKTKEVQKYQPYQPLSSTNLDHLKRLPQQYSTLRQTLNFKTYDFEASNFEDEKQKLQRSSHYLRQTVNNKGSLKPRSDKIFSESFAGHQSHSTHDFYHKHDHYAKNEISGALGYSKISSPTLTEIRSMQTLYDSKHEQKSSYNKKKGEERKDDWKDNVGKWKQESTMKGLNEGQQHSKIIEQIKILKKIAGQSNFQEDIKEQKKTPIMERKYSYNFNDSPSNPLQQSVFRKKIKQKEQAPECFTPKLPKYTYQERFKIVGSPTSTDNSDSRSPPNKYVETNETKKKPSRLSIQQFQVGKIVGQGKFGQVMICNHKKTSCLVAVKKIAKAMIKSHFMIEQLTLQIRLQSCLNHKNILGMYGFFDDQTHFYIVLQYMDQGTLYSQLKKNKILQQQEAAAIVKQMVEAVEYLHDLQIAHRDIKPQNIVISNNVYKLCDFGWATICDQRRKTYCGTFDYAAPQILEGKEYDMSVDLWCLGVLTFELLTGKAPFYHLSRKETMKKILNVQTEAIVFPETMSREAIDFIEKLIRKDPNQRMNASDSLKHPFLRNVSEA